MSTDVDIQIDEKIVIELKEPNLYKVIFLNDDATPMDFVVSLLIEFFKHSEDTARDLTMKIHSEGSGVVGIYTYEIAEQKSTEATNICRSNGFPLRIRIEEDV